MRRIFFVLLIALLPFRVWVGDAMATTMANAAVHTAVQTAESTTHQHQAHLEASAQEHESHDLHHETPCGDGHTCQTCQTCHSAALSPSAPVLDKPVLRQAKATARPVRYASAPAALSQKPPIF